MNFSTCKGCGASILWIHTVAGKNMPCDPYVKPYWEDPAGNQTIVTQYGETVRCFLSGNPEAASGQGYTSHFATCPKAARFSRKRQPAGRTT